MTTVGAPHFVLVCFLLLASIGGIVGDIETSQGESPLLSAAASLPTPTLFDAAYAARQADIVSTTIALVEENSFDGGLALTDTSSPQYKALDWLLNNTNLVSYSNQTKLQRFALAALYYSTNGMEWTKSLDWLTDEPECQWFPSSSTTVTCSDGEFLSTLDLDYNKLVGTLPPELALLSSSLETMNLWGNSLSGPIPTAFENLANLVSVQMDRNSLSGPIPTTIGNLKSLEHLDLRFNDLSSSIPSQVGLMSSLEFLDLFNNNFNSSIPTEIGQLSNRLESLSLARNKLTGTIPSEIGRAATLKTLLLYNNALTGTIPSEINGMVNLGDLNLYSNQLSGTIPSEIGRATSLISLVLFSNTLTGQIPSEIGRATSLTSLILFNNALKGPIPPEIGSATSLRTLDLSNNALTGTIPSEINGMTNLRLLYLFGNDLTPPFTCPDFIERCYISCEDSFVGFDSNCRVL